MQLLLWLTRFLTRLALALALASVGCQTPPKGERPLASVVIPGQTPAAIRDAARRVFEEEGYTGVWGVMSMVFQRPGSTLDNLAYGGWDLSSVTVRVELTIAEVGTVGHRLDCDVHLVRNAGDHVFEDSHKKTGKGGYQKMLDRVRDQLAKPPP